VATASKERVQTDSGPPRAVEGTGESRALPRQDRAQRSRHRSGRGRHAGVDRQARYECAELRAPDDGSAVGLSLDESRQRTAAQADVAFEGTMGARRGDAGALLLA